MSVVIHGDVHPRFGAVAEAFRRNFAEEGEVGASLCVRIDGEVVIDLWGGLADVATKRAFQADTRTIIFSATKGLTATAFLVLIDRGLLEPERTVASYWPGFAQAGKERITVRQLLDHRAGLAYVDGPLPLSAFADPASVDAKLEAQRPAWVPGMAQGYGATSWGMYAGALFRKVTGESVGAFLRREIWDRWNFNVHLPLQPGDDRDLATLYPADLTRLAPTILPEVWRGETLEGRFYRQFLTNRDSFPARALNQPDLGKRRLAILNDPEPRTWETPWMGAWASARGLAGHYALLAGDGSLDGKVLLSPQTLALAHARSSWAWDDRVLGKGLGFTLGFMKEEPAFFSPNEAAFGHPGAGGSLGMADPKHKLAIGYVANSMHWRLRSPRTQALCRALYGALGYG